MEHAARTSRRLAAFALAALTACVLSFGLFGCSNDKQAPEERAGQEAPAAQAEPAGGTVSFTDSCGRTVELPTSIDRVAVSGPLAQQVMMTIAPEKMVGLATELSDAQIRYLGSELAALPVYGQIYGGKGDFNKEAVAAADPQVIIDIGEAKKTIVEDLDELQEQTGIPCIHVEAGIDSYDQAYLILGELLGKQDKAAELAQYCASAYEETQKAMASIPEDKRVRIAYLMGDEGLNAMQKGSFQAQVVDMMAANVVEVDEKSGKGVEISFEQLASWNPDMIVFASGSVYDQADSDETWQTLSAIESGEYYEVPGAPYNWLSSPPSVNQVLGMQYLGRLCYPDAFDASMEDVVRSYYKTFYGYDLTADECAGLLAHAQPAYPAKAA